MNPDGVKVGDIIEDYWSGSSGTNQGFWKVTEVNGNNITVKGIGSRVLPTNYNDTEIKKRISNLENRPNNEDDSLIPFYKTTMFKLLGLNYFKLVNKTGKWLFLKFKKLYYGTESTLVIDFPNNMRDLVEGSQFEYYIKDSDFEIYDKDPRVDTNASPILVLDGKTKQWRRPYTISLLTQLYFKIDISSLVEYIYDVDNKYEVKFDKNKLENVPELKNNIKKITVKQITPEKVYLNIDFINGLTRTKLEQVKSKLREYYNIGYPMSYKNNLINFTNNSAGYDVSSYSYSGSDDNYTSATFEIIVSAITLYDAL